MHDTYGPVAPRRGWFAAREPLQPSFLPSAYRQEIQDDAILARLAPPRPPEIERRSRISLTASFSPPSVTLSYETARRFAPQPPQGR